MFFNNVFLVTWFEYSGAKGNLGAASQCSEMANESDS